MQHFSQIAPRVCTSVLFIKYVSISAAKCLLKNWTALSHWCNASSYIGLHLLGASTFDYIFRGISACNLIPDIEELPDAPIRKIANKVFEVFF